MNACESDLEDNRRGDTLDLGGLPGRVFLVGLVGLPGRPGHHLRRFGNVVHDIIYIEHWNCKVHDAVEEQM